MPTKPKAKKEKTEIPSEGSFDQVLRKMLGTPPEPKGSPNSKKAGSARTDPAMKPSAKKT